EDGGEEAAVQAQRGVPHCVYTAIELVKAASTNLVLDRASAHSDLEQLPNRHDAVLSLGQSGDPAIKWAGLGRHMRPNPAQSIIRPGGRRSLVKDQRVLRQLRNK